METLAKPDAGIVGLIISVVTAVLLVAKFFDERRNKNKEIAIEETKASEGVATLYLNAVQSEITSLRNQIGLREEAHRADQIFLQNEIDGLRADLTEAREAHEKCESERRQSREEVHQLKQEMRKLNFAMDEMKNRMNS